MRYEERNKCSIEATRDTYKEIAAAIEAIFRQGQYIERHINLLKALRAYAIHPDEGQILELHLGMLRNQMQQMKTACKDLMDDFENQILKAIEAEELMPAQCRG